MHTLEQFVLALGWVTVGFLGITALLFGLVLLDIGFNGLVNALGSRCVGRRDRRSRAALWVTVLLSRIRYPRMPLRRGLHGIWLWREARERRQQIPYRLRSNH